MLLMRISGVPRLLLPLNGGLHYSALPVERGRRARWRRRRVRTVCRIFRSAEQVPSGVLPLEYTSPECLRGRLLRAAPDGGPARGCEYCPALIAQSRALPGLLRELSSLRGGGFLHGRGASRWPSGPGRIRRGVRGRCGAGWLPAWRSVSGRVRCAVRREWLAWRTAKRTRPETELHAG